MHGSVFDCLIFLCRCYQQDIGAAGTADLKRLQKIEEELKNQLREYDEHNVEHNAEQQTRDKEDYDFEPIETAEPIKKSQCKTAEDYDRLKEQLSMLELEQVQLLVTHSPALHVHCLITSSYSLPH